MKILLILALIILPAVAMSQSLTQADSLQARLKTLENLKQSLESEQREVAKQIEAIKDQIQLLTEQKSYRDGKLMVKCKGGYLMTTPSFDGDMIVQVPGGATIAVFPDYYHDGYVKASYLSHEGFIYEVVLHGTPELDAMIGRMARKARQQAPSVEQTNYIIRKDLPVVVVTTKARRGVITPVHAGVAIIFLQAEKRCMWIDLFVTEGCLSISH